MSEDSVRARLRESAAMVERLEAEAGTIAAVAARLAESYRGGGKLILFGNGGSAAEAQHVAAEFVGRYLKEREALPAIALTANSSSVTAIANDYGYRDVFVRQMEAFGSPGDVALGMSTSGGSENVVAALQAAKERGLVTVALTGEDGAACAAAADFCIRVPSDETPRIQEGHALVCHLICELVEHELFP